MGKNDLWIAALVSLLGLMLVTMDNDFDHLNGLFFEGVCQPFIQHGQQLAAMLLVQLLKRAMIAFPQLQ